MIKFIKSICVWNRPPENIGVCGQIEQEVDEEEDISRYRNPSPPPSYKTEQICITRKVTVKDYTLSEIQLLIPHTPEFSFTLPVEDEYILQGYEEEPEKICKEEEEEDNEEEKENKVNSIKKGKSLKKTDSKETADNDSQCQSSKKTGHPPSKRKRISYSQSPEVESLAVPVITLDLETADNQNVTNIEGDETAETLQILVDLEKQFLMEKNGDLQMPTSQDANNSVEPMEIVEYSPSPSPRRHSDNDSPRVKHRSRSVSRSLSKCSVKGAHHHKQRSSRSSSKMRNMHERSLSRNKHDPRRSASHDRRRSLSHDHRRSPSNHSTISSHSYRSRRSRKHSSDGSEIQKFENDPSVYAYCAVRTERVMQKIDFPCVGLDYVYEVPQDPNTEITFLCEICGAKCSERSLVLHLNSVKHHLKCLKKFKVALYERFKRGKKSAIADPVRNGIRTLEFEIGRGKITKKGPGFRPRTPSCSPPPIHRMPPSSYGPQPMNYPIQGSISYGPNPPVPPIPTPQPWRLNMPEELIKDFAKPDLSKGDFYCRLCDSHMSSDIIWESHIIGKRHLKNLKKVPDGDPPSKTKSFKCNSVCSKLFADLEEIDKPIIGLDYICEKLMDDNLRVLYTCYLCSSNNTRLTIIEHLLSSKHRLNYMEKMEASAFPTLSTVELPKKNLDELIEYEAQKLEQEYGRGKIEVRKEIVH